MQHTHTNTAEVTHQDLHQHLEDKILRIFDTYPTISPSMLQITIGSNFPTSIWKPVLENLIQQGKLFRYTKPVTGLNGRCQMATIISNNEPPESID